MAARAASLCIDANTDGRPTPATQRKLFASVVVELVDRGEDFNKTEVVSMVPVPLTV